MDKKDCFYCGNPTEDVLELGRGVHTKEIPCCQECFEEIDKLPQNQKDEMAEYAFISILGGGIKMIHGIGD